MGELFLPALGLFGVIAVPVSVVGFMIARFVLAVGEAGNFPGAIKATAEYFPQKERSLATGIFNSGANVGAILAPLSVPWIAEVWGWQFAFIIIGAIGFVWLFFWQRMYDHPTRQKAMTNEERIYILGSTTASEVTEKKTTAPWLTLLKYRATWAFTLGKFFTDGVWWFYLFWLPAYLKDQYNLVGISIMLPLTVLYSITMFGSIGGGYLPTLLASGKQSLYQTRLRAMGGIALLPLVVLLAQPYGSLGVWVPVLLIGVGAAAHQAWSANLFTTVSDMFPQQAVASVVGIGGMAGGIGSVVITQVGGFLFDHYKALEHIETGYTIMFAFCAVAYLIAWSAIKLLVPVEKPIQL
jgi:ACS family hexuronate transporter-like MFS transporter